MADSITAFGNLLFVIFGVYLFTYNVIWVVNNRVTPENIPFLIAVGAIVAAVTVRIGYWALALILALPTPETYPEWFIENKHIMTLPTSILYAFGVLGFISFIQKMDWQEIALIGLSALMMSASIVAFW